MKILCKFLTCKYMFICNVMRRAWSSDSGLLSYNRVGLYQCTRCKEVSIGSPVVLKDQDGGPE